ncbi:MAG: flagellar biosynthesis anti-sigma factor FlgM [Comamonas sp.]
MAISPLINNPTSPTSPAAVLAGERGRASSASGTDRSASAADSAAVTLSEASRSASGQEAPVASGDIDQARVQGLIEAIRSGQYSVDTSKIADGLIAGVRDLLK